MKTRNTRSKALALGLLVACAALWVVIKVPAQTEVAPNGPDDRPQFRVTNKNHLLKGWYSGEMHGETTDGQPVWGILVVGFDGNGNVTGGRIIEERVFGGYGEVQITGASNEYTVDSDGMGFMSLSTDLYDIEYKIAVGDGGRIVKFIISDLKDRTGDTYGAVGDLVKQ